MNRTRHPSHRGPADDTPPPHARHTPLVHAALLAALAVLGCGQAQADFTLVEDFESHTSGAALTAKGNWFAQGGINPATGGTIIFEGSKCARILGGSNNGCYYLPLGANAIADDTTGTLFFRFRSQPAAWLQIAAYLTNWQPTSGDWWGHDQAGFYSRWNMGDGTALRPRWNSGDNTRDVVGGSWYNVWIVADNAANTYALYLSQGTDPATGGASSITVATGIPFRYATDALDYLYFADTDGNATTGILLDDIHVDTGGTNLANPWTIPVPPDSFTRPGVTTADAANLGSGLTSTFGVGTGGDLVTIVNPNTLSIAATHTVNIVPLPGITPSVYTLIDYDGAIGGSGYEGLALGALPHMDAELQHNTTDRKIELVVHSVSTIYWDGDGGNSDWDTNTTPNWFENADNDNEKFLPYDAVQFDDDAATYTDGLIRVVGTVTPRSVTFSNEANAYTLTGGTVSSVGGLSKSGGATLTLLNPNEFGVESLVTGGTLAIGDGTTGSLACNISIGAGAEVILNPADGSTYGHDLSGGGTLTKAGTGTLTMSRPNNGFTGTLLVDEGKLVASAYAGWRLAALRIASGGTLSITATNGLQFHNKPIVVEAGGKLEVAAGLPSNIGPGALSTLQLEGGAELASGTPDPTWGSWVINTAGYGIAVAGGTGAAVISARNLTVAGDAPSTLTLNVADVTADTAADLVVSGSLGAPAVNTFNVLITGDGTVEMSGPNTYTGSTTVTAHATLMLADAPASRLAFAIGANGVNNKITGTGTAVLNGSFAVNLTGAETTPGSSWTLVDMDTLTASFGEWLAVINPDGTPWSNDGGSEWSTTTAGGRLWIFDKTTATLTVSVTAGFSSWIAGFGLDLADQGPTEDPDQDGIPNLVEYALAGRNPALADGPAGSFANGLLSFAKREDASGISYVIEESDDLGVTDPWTAVTPTTDTATEITWAMLPADRAKRFARLSVTASQ